MIFSNDLKLINQLKKELKDEYDLTDLGEAQWILGMEIIRDWKERTIQLSQKRYVEMILEHFGMQDARPVVTPMDPNTKLVKAEDPEMETRTYQSALRALMYAMLATCPDLAYSVGALSKHSAKPTPEHWTALMRVYRYLRKMADKRLTFRGKDSATPIGYVDVDWASDVNDRRSITGYVFVMAGGAVSWSSKKQDSVALSSMEAEYMAAASATREAVWMRTFLSEIRILPTQRIRLLIDNQSAISLAKNTVFHSRTKHIAIRYHFIRKKVDSGEIELKYVPTNWQVADVLTKALG